MAKNAPNVIFLKVDVDELKFLLSSIETNICMILTLLRTVADEWAVEAIPTFLFLKEGKLVDKVVGTKKEELQMTIAKHATNVK
ncbi:hypothetical protein SO802_004152 [Lithocarpus litseifolius]|uniref:Thioredoxin domain-containing protein n=1 Tax=Lithocarpus litseifolius TaxID=425828 RepID=A0AAW2E5P3_9ROSI